MNQTPVVNFACSRTQQVIQKVFDNEQLDMCFQKVRDDQIKFI